MVNTRGKKYGASKSKKKADTVPVLDKKGPFKLWTKAQREAYYKARSKPMTSAQKKYLHKIYYNDKNFFGRDKLYSLVRAKGITPAQIMKWLKEQEISQVYRRPLRSTKVIQPTVLNSPYAQIAIDLMDMQKQSVDNVKYILTGVDLFTKRIWAIPMKNKLASTTVKAFEKMLSDMKKTPKSIRSDNGSEFVAKPFKALLKSKGIKQIFSLPEKPQSNGAVERANQTIKRLINMAIKSSDDLDWVKKLDTLVANYNKVPNSTTRKTPLDVEAGDEEASKKTKARIKERVMKGRKNDTRPLQVGNRVRIKIDVVREGRDRNRQLWSNLVFTIKSVNKAKEGGVGATYYRVKPKQGDRTKAHTRKIYRQDLQLITKVTNPIKKQTLYEISHLVRPWFGVPPQQRHIAGKKTDEAMYEIKYKKQKQTENESREWMLQENPKLVRTFERVHNVKWSVKARAGRTGKKGAIIGLKSWDKRAGTVKKR